MISVKLQGGLGNVMFQIAFIETLGRKYGLKVGYAGMGEWIKDCDNRGREWPKYLNMFRYLSFPVATNDDIKRTIKVPFYYKEIIPEDGDCFVGYFQSEKYFDPYVFNYCFTPADGLSSLIGKYEPMTCGLSCSIHVRRGDYVGLPRHHPVLPIEYYEEALWNLESLGITHYLIFSDDIGWCKERFGARDMFYVEEPDYVSLPVMAQCRHHIIANSSLSWIAARLGESQKGTVVVAPKKWFGDAYAADYGRDLLPSRWVKI